MFLDLRSSVWQRTKKKKKECKRVHYKAQFHLSHKCHKRSVEEVQWEVKRGEKVSTSS